MDGMTYFVIVKFWDATQHRCEVLPETDIHIATLGALSDLARGGIFKTMRDVQEVSFDAVPTHLVKEGF